MKRIFINFLLAVVLTLPVYANTSTDGNFPSADNVAIDGVAYVGGKIKGIYDYIGVGDVEQGESHFQWLACDEVDGEYISVEGQTTTELIIDESLLGKYIKFEVTPVGEDGAEGLAVLSEAVLEQSVPQLYFEEDFSELDTDISDANGWVLSTGGGTVGVNNGCLELIASGTSSSTVGAERRFSSVNGVFVVDFTFTMTKKQVTNLLYAYEAGAYAFNISADVNNIGVYVGDGGFASAKRENLLLGYQINTPYHITVLVNTDSDRLSIAINDEWKLENAFLRKDVTTGLDKFLSAFSSNESSTLSISQYSITKYVKSPDLESVLKDVELLDLNAEEGVEEDLILPTSGVNGSTIRWESSDPEVISNSGTVVRSLEGDVDVKLTAYLQKGNSPEISVEFTVKVLQFIMPMPSERINSSLLSIELPQDAITKDLTLNTHGDFDVVIQWSSSDESVISSEGKVSRPSKDTYVTLTATATAGGESDERNFTLLVKGKPKSSGGSSGGSGGGSRNKSNKKKELSSAVYVPTAQPQPSEEKVTEPIKVYTDIDGYKWAEEAIMYLTLKEVVKGTGEATFEPHRNITREEFIHMIVNAFDINDLDNVQSFNDVEKESWYAQSVLAAKKIGLVMGKGDNTFGVGECITRQDAAVMLYRILKMKDADMYAKQRNSFVDSDEVAQYAVEAIDVLWTNDIVEGSENGYFYPINNMNRAEACKLLYGAIVLLERS